MLFIRLRASKPSMEVRRSGLIRLSPSTSLSEARTQSGQRRALWLISAMSPFTAWPSPQSRIPGGNTRPHKDGANAVVAVQPGDVLDSIDINT